MAGASYDDPISLDEESESGYDHDVIPRQEDLQASRKRARLDNESTGTIHCMMNPTSPIKLFATRQDMQLRKYHPEKDHWSYTQCWTLRELLGVDGTVRERIEWLVVSNFIVDFEFLLEEVPELLSIPTVLVVYGHADNSPEAWQTLARSTPTNNTGSFGSAEFLRRDPGAPPRSAANPLSVSLPYGCHHTKLFLVGYSSGRLRVIVHTCNLRRADVHDKCQGAFVQDFPLKENEFSVSPFEEALTDYLETYQFHQPRQWTHRVGLEDNSSCSLVDQVSKYDFSKAKGVLIPSTPGWHKPSYSKPKWGYLKVRQAIRDHTPTIFKTTTERSSPWTKHDKTAPDKSPPVVCQFSSIGALSLRYLERLWSAWDLATVHCGSNSKTKTSQTPKVSQRKDKPGSLTRQQLQLVYPTKMEILNSVEGRLGGNSVPGRAKNLERPCLQGLFHRWSSYGHNQRKPQRNVSSDENDSMGKGRNVPHLKTYYQWMPPSVPNQRETGDSKTGFLWFMISSHNLSKGK